MDLSIIVFSSVFHHPFHHQLSIKVLSKIHIIKYSSIFYNQIFITFHHQIFFQMSIIKYLSPISIIKLLSCNFHSISFLKYLSSNFLYQYSFKCLSPISFINFHQQIWKRIIINFYPHQFHYPYHNQFSY